MLMGFQAGFTECESRFGFVIRMHFFTESETRFSVNPNPDSIIEYALKQFNGRHSRPTMAPAPSKLYWAAGTGLMQSADDSLLVPQCISYSFYTSDPRQIICCSPPGVSFPQLGVKCHPLGALPPLDATLVNEQQ